MKFFAAVAFHFCPSLPTAFKQPGASTLADLCTHIFLGHFPVLWWDPASGFGLSSRPTVLAKRVRVIAIYRQELESCFLFSSLLFIQLARNNLGRIGVDVS